MRAHRFEHLTDLHGEDLYYMQFSEFYINSLILMLRLHRQYISDHVMDIRLTGFTRGPYAGYTLIVRVDHT